jgi:hypothetical protein
MLAPERSRQKGMGGEQKSDRGDGRSVLTEGRAERTLISSDMLKRHLQVSYWHRHHSEENAALAPCSPLVQILANLRIQALPPIADTRCRGMFPISPFYLLVPSGGKTYSSTFLCVSARCMRFYEQKAERSLNINVLRIFFAPMRMINIIFALLYKAEE